MVMIVGLWRRKSDLAWMAGGGVWEGGGGPAVVWGQLLLVWWRGAPPCCCLRLRHSVFSQSSVSTWSTSRHHITDQRQPRSLHVWSLTLVKARLNITECRQLWPLPGQTITIIKTQSVSDPHNVDSPSSHQSFSRLQHRLLSSHFHCSHHHLHHPGQ